MGRHRVAAGVTLIELAVVLMIIGLLAVIGFPVFSEGQVGARRNKCLEHQRAIYEAALIYCAESVVPDGGLNVSALHPGLVQSVVADCPTSTDASGDDYTIVIQNGDPVDVVCDIQGDRHPWDPS